MKTDAGLTSQDRQRLRAVAEPIYREASGKSFAFALNDGWDVLEDDGRPIFYISVRLDFADERHWFTRFKLPGVLEDPERWFRADAAQLRRAI